MRFYVGGGFRSVAHALEFSRHAEAVGFDGVTFGEHVVLATEPSATYPSADGRPTFALDAPWPDPWVLAGALAMVTSRVRFLTTVFVLPLRSPLLSAKAVGTAVMLSGGRVEVGIGVGWQREEFHALGADFATRGARTDEAITVLRALWGPGPVEHHGRFFDFGPVLMEPVPTSAPPIYVGGSSAAAMQRAARLGDGFISMPATFDELAELIPHLRSLVAEAGRDPDRFQIFANCKEATSRQDYSRLAEMGADVALVRPVNLQPAADDATALAESMATFASAVIAPLRGAT